MAFFLSLRFTETGQFDVFSIDRTAWDSFSPSKKFPVSSELCTMSCYLGFTVFEFLFYHKDEDDNVS